MLQRVVTSSKIEKMTSPLGVIVLILKITMAVKRNITIGIVSSLMVSGVVFGVVSAQTTLSSDQTKQISDSCLLTKNTLSQLHSSDALLRVNRGQIYESMHTKLMNRFNARVSNNKLDSTNLIAASKEYGLALDDFRLNYIVYEEQLSKAIAIDCSTQPVRFYEAVALAKVKREIVHNDVIKLNQQIDNYKFALGQFKDEFNNKTEENK